MEVPEWIDRQILLSLHERSLVLFGGSRGIRDAGLLDSALARAQNRFSYEPESTVYRLAAAYCFGIARNHPFVDGNKRSALTAMGLFLSINGFELEADQAEVEQVVVRVAVGEMDEDELARWLEGRCVGETGL